MSLLNYPNPDYYTYIRKNGMRDECVIYSTLENLILAPTLSGDISAHIVDSGKDLCIYADTITIYGKISIPGGNIKIIA